MAFVPPARHLLRAKDLADARYFEPLGVDDLAAPPASRARTSAASSAARSASRRTRTCSPAASSGPPRCCARPTARSPTSASSVGLQSVGSFTTSFTRMYGVSPTAYRAAFPPAATHALVPACVVRASTAARNTARFEKTAARRRV